MKRIATLLVLPLLISGLQAADYAEEIGKYNQDEGLRILADGQEIGASRTLERLTAPLPPRQTNPFATTDPTKTADDVNAAATDASWLKHPANPVLGGQDYGTIFDVSVVPIEGEYWMYVSWRPKKSIALSKSKDGVNWRAPKIVLGPADTGWEDGINRPGVVYREGVFHLWYTGQAKSRSKIGYATSKDGIHWEKHASNPIFKADPEKQWEQNKVTACQIVRHADWHLMFYIGFEHKSLARIGLARSRDGITAWERHPANPIISPTEGAWDGASCYKPFAIYEKERNRWLLWYNGRSRGEMIGLAIHDGEDLGFPE